MSLVGDDLTQSLVFNMGLTPPKVTLQKATECSAHSFLNIVYGILKHTTIPSHTGYICRHHSSPLNWNLIQYLQKFSSSFVHEDDKK